MLAQVASVEDTLRQLDATGSSPLPSAYAAMPRPAARTRQPRMRNARASSSSESSSSSSSSESEDERSPAARFSRRLEEQLVMRRELAAAAAAGNIMPAPAFSTTAAPTAAPTVARVCMGKKCSAGGAAGVLATLGSMPGVAAVPAPKCLGKCRLCVAVKMSSDHAGDVLYTGVTPANAAGVLATHRQHAPPPPLQQQQWAAPAATP